MSLNPPPSSAKRSHPNPTAHPRSSTLTLFKDISNITWDYTADSVKGYVSKSDKHDIKRFEFDASMTKFDTTNKLWELIGEN